MSTTPTTVMVSQLLYSRVEPAYSAENKGGFQTVYKTSSLSDKEVKAIEERVQSFAPMNPTQLRYQFFRLESGSFVITHSCRIESHGEITDAERRTGAFIAHCLVISPAEFAKVQNNPFALLMNFSFLEDPVRMVAEFGRATGIAPMIPIPGVTPIPTTQAGWENREMSKWVALAVSSKYLQQQRQSVQVLGEQADITAALVLVFHLINQETRLWCSFNTFAESASAKLGEYWAMGSSQRQSRFAYIVSATHRRVEMKEQLNLPSTDLYFVWLKEALAKQSKESVMEKAPWMQTVSEALALKNSSLLDQVPPTFYEEFAFLHHRSIADRLQAAFAEFVRPELATVLTNYLLEQRLLLDGLRMATQQKLDVKEVANLLCAWIDEKKPQLQDKEWAQLQLLAKQANHAYLLYLSASLCKKPDHKLQNEALAHIDSDVFRKLLAWLFNPITPASMVAPAHMSLLLKDERLERMTNEQFIELLKAIVLVHEARHLNDLAAYVSRLSGKELSHIKKIIKKLPTRPTLFMTAIEQQQKQLGTEKPIWQRIWRKFRHSSN